MRSRRLLDSFNYAIDGLLYSLRSQRNMRIHFGVALLVLIGAVALGLTRIEILILVLTVLMVITAEMINTAIEATVDLITGTYHPLARIAKNVSAGAVLVVTMGAVFVGYYIFNAKLTALTFSTLRRASQVPANWVALTIGLVLILVVIGKAFSPVGTYTRGGMPSGHSAVAFSLATTISLLSKDGYITILAMLLAALVAQSRVEPGFHTTFQVIAGAVLGALATLLVYSLAI